MESSEREMEALRTAENKLDFKVGTPKKKKVKKEIPKQRIVICGTTSWHKRSAMKRALLEVGRKDIQYVVLGINRGAEQLATMICKELDIPFFQVWYKDKFIAANLVLSTFKPTLILAFNEKPKENLATDNYQKLARRKDIDFRMISK